MAGIDGTGFTQKSYQEILDDTNDATIAVFGPAINLQPESPDGQINGAIAESDTNLWELAQKVYDAFDPNAVTGIDQDRLYALNGIKRLEPTSSIVPLDMVGTPATIIPQGSLVESAAGDQFATVDQVTLDGGGLGTTGKAVETGPIAASIGSVTTILTSVPGWSTVNNPVAATIGTDEETNAAFRLRRTRSVARSSRSMIESIYSEIANLDGVVSVTVLENDEDIVDINGLQPHSVAAIVLGGDEQEIAEAIFNEKAAGIYTNGTIVKQVEDIQGQLYDIRLQRPTAKTVWVIVNLTTFAGFPAGGANTIKNNIVEFAEEKFAVGDNVIDSLLYTPVNEVPGLTINNILIGFSNPPTLATDLPVAFDEISTWDIARITVNV